MVNECMETRKIKVELSKHLNINMKPEFAKALAECQSYSSKCYHIANYSRFKGQICWYDERLIQKKKNQGRDGGGERVWIKPKTRQTIVSPEN